MDKKRFLALDSFRGLCALFIVFNHAEYLNSICEWSFFRNAGIFVEFFFVLSGFVLAHSYGFKAGISFKRFVVSRSFRLFPLHLVTLLSVIALELVKLVAEQKGLAFSNPAFTGLKSLDELIPNLLLIHAWSNNFITTSFNGPSWSISIEYYMYMIFFITLIGLARYKQYVWLTISLIVYAMLLFDINLFTPFVLRGLSCFFAGAFIYYLRKTYFPQTRLSVGLASVLEIIILVAIVILVSFKFNNQNIVASLLFCLCVFLFSYERGFVSQQLIRGAFTYLGKISYSIYLCHAPIMFYAFAMTLLAQKILNKEFVLYLNDERFVSFGGALVNNLALFAIVLLVVIVSHFTYKYVELPGQNLGKKFIK